MYQDDHGIWSLVGWRGLGGVGQDHLAGWSRSVQAHSSSVARSVQGAESRCGLCFPTSQPNSQWACSPNVRLQVELLACYSLSTVVQGANWSQGGTSGLFCYCTLLEDGPRTMTCLLPQEWSSTRLFWRKDCWKRILQSSPFFQVP